MPVSARWYRFYGIINNNREMITFLMIIHCPILFEGAETTRLF